jgi:hypothetical protein
MSDRPEDRRSAVRMKYDVSYWAADSDGEGIPPPSQFRQVRGCDLSPIGISFYAEVAATSEHVVLMFRGQKHQSYMLARVVHQKSCLVEGQRRHLVGCRFVRGLPDSDE